MSVTCLTITQPGRLALLKHAIGDFSHQTLKNRELLIVHDGDAAFDRTLREFVASFSGHNISVHAAPAGTSLGALRNLSVELATSEFVCQWDDDDRYHPLRLQLQFDALRREEADFSFLCDQLHWFPDRGQMYWTDWNIEPYPMNFIQGTMFGRKERMPQYPALMRGEDTFLCMEILRAGRRITRIRDQGWCYIYICHGTNAWSLAHHRAIIAHKRLDGSQLLSRKHILQERLPEYAPTPGHVVMPSRSGELVFD